MQTLRDFQVVGTPLRGLILRGDFGMCAYVGVPEDHLLAGLEEFRFPCHWGLTWNGPGDGNGRASNHYWFGWDYAHAGDAVQIEPDLLDLLPEGARQFFENQAKRGRKWTVEEVEHDVIDAALEVMKALMEAHLIEPARLPPELRPPSD